MAEINDLMPDNLIEIGTNAVNTLLPSNTEAISDVPYATSAGTLYEEKRVLDITKVPTSMSIAKTLYLRRGEGNATTLIAEVKDAGATLNLTGFTATFKMLNPNNQYVNVPASIDNAASGEVSVVIPHDMTEVSGGTEIAYFEFTNGTEIATTNDIPIVVLDSNDLTPDQQAKYQTQIDKMIAQLEQKIITSVRVEYKTHTTNASVPTGTWSTSLPVAGSGQWLWTRRTTTYRDGTTTVEYSYAYQGKDNANYGVATTTQQGLMSGEMVTTLNSLKSAWDSAGMNRGTLPGSLDWKLIEQAGQYRIAKSSFENATNYPSECYTYGILISSIAKVSTEIYKCLIFLTHENPSVIYIASFPETRVAPLSWLKISSSGITQVSGYTA